MGRKNNLHQFAYVTIYRNKSNIITLLFLIFTANRQVVMPDGLDKFTMPIWGLRNPVERCTRRTMQHFICVHDFNPFLSNPPVFYSNSRQTPSTANTARSSVSIFQGKTQQFSNASLDWLPAPRT